MQSEKRGRQTVSPARWLADFLGLKRNLVVLLVAIFVIGAGEELWMRFVPKYLQAVGATVFVIGLYDALRTLLGAIYAYPGGVLVDVWGHRRVSRVQFISSPVTRCPFIPHWGAVIGMFYSFPDLFSCRPFSSSARPRGRPSRASASIVIKRSNMIAPIFGEY